MGEGTQAARVRPLAWARDCKMGIACRKRLILLDVEIIQARTLQATLVQMPECGRRHEEATWSEKRTCGWWRFLLE